MIDDKGYVRISKTGRNGYGVGTEQLTVTLPQRDIQYLVDWAESRHVTVSRAVHDILLDYHHYERGTHKPYDPTKTDNHE